MNLKKYFLIIFLSAISVVFAQDGVNDTTFNPADFGFGNGTDKPIQTLALQPDGKIIVGGEFQFFKGISRKGIARINPDETLDMAFDPGSGANGVIEILKLLPSGKIFIGGDFTEYNGVSRNRIALLNSDGSLDTSFDPQGGCNAIVEALAAQPDGKIVIGGKFTQYNSTATGGIARLNSDGSRDASFIATGAAPTYLNGPPMVHKLLLQADGKIIVGGTFNTFNSLSRNSIVRLSTDGSVDGAFLGTGFPGGSVLSLALATDNKIYVGGWQVDYITRLNIDGTKDTSFARPNMSGAINDISVQQDSKVVIAGLININNGPQNIARLNSNGTVDQAFITQGLDAHATSLAITPSGKIVVGGYFLAYNDTSRNFIATINPDGSADAGFNAGMQSGADNTIQSSLVLPNQKIIIVGDFFNYNGVARSKIAKLTQDGLLDTGFNPGLGANKSIKKVYALPDGKLLILGDFTQYDGQPANRIARVNADGTLDSSFTANINVGGVSQVIVQPDGKIIFGGSYLITNAGYVWIVRVNVDGSIDDTFNNYLSAEVKDMKLDSAGKIMVSHTSGDYPIRRLNTNGTLDNSFSVSSNPNAVMAFDIQPDGKIIYITTANFGIVYIVKRLNIDGSPDTQFLSPALATQPITLIKSQADGKIIIYGNFMYYNNVPGNGLLRLNNDGSVDTTFSSGLGTNDAIYSISPQETGKLIISGYFTHYDGAGRNRIARVFGTGSTLGTGTLLPVSNEIIAFRNDGRIMVKSSDKDIEAVQVYDISGRLIDSVESVFTREISLQAGTQTKILIINIKVSDGTFVTKKIY